MGGWVHAMGRGAAYAYASWPHTIRAVVVDLIGVGVLGLEEEDVEVVFDEQRERVVVPMIHKAVKV